MRTHLNNSTNESEYKHGSVARNNPWLATMVLIIGAAILLSCGNATLATTTSSTAIPSMSASSTPAQAKTSAALATPMVTPISHPLQPTVTSTPYRLQPTAVPTAIVYSAPAPQPTAKPRPTATHTPTPHLFIQFTCAQAANYSYGRVCVHTQPYAQLTITVRYCSGYEATSRSLRGTFAANGNGDQEWTWTPETKCAGTAIATVGASWQGQSTTNTDAFQVTGS